MEGKALPQHIIDAMSPADRKSIGIFSTEEREERQELVSERVIQTTVEAYLTQLGYEKRTPENIARGMPRSGWQIHLFATKRNPLLCDLIVLSHTKQYLELELKTLTGKITVEQQALIAQGASLARGSIEAIAIIREWHDKQIKEG